MLQAKKRRGSTGGSRGSYTGSVDEEDEEDREDEDEDEGDEEAALNPEKPATKVKKRANLGKKSLGTNRMDDDKWGA